jgi:hypothetical protein
MKSMKRVLAMTIASGISVFSFAQVNLGLQSTTQAAINATAATNAITNTTNAASQATRTTVNTTVAKLADVKSTTVSTVNATGTQGLTATKEIGSSVNANAGISSSSNGEVNGQGATLSGNNALSANAEVKGDKLVNQADQTTAATVNTAKDVKSKAVTEVKSGIGAAKESAASVKPAIEANGSAGASAAGSVK